MFLIFFHHNYIDNQCNGMVVIFRKDEISEEDEDEEDGLKVHLLTKNRIHIYQLMYRIL